jgi:hypothetical protein
MVPLPEQGDVSPTKATGPFDTKYEARGADGVIPLWNLAAKRHGYVVSRGKAGARKRVASRLSDREFRDGWREAIDILDEKGPHPHLAGKNDRGWRADLEWFLSARALRKILDGAWDAPKKLTVKEQLDAWLELPQWKQDEIRDIGALRDAIYEGRGEEIYDHTKHGWDARSALAGGEGSL